MELHRVNWRAAIRLTIAGALCVLAARAIAQDTPASRMVEARKKSSQPWESFPTRTLADLPGFSPAAPPPALTRYGGWADRKEKATGYFHTARIDGRWWLVDPDGSLFIHVGLAAVGAGGSVAEPALISKFGSDQGWADKTLQMLEGYGFNGAGAWSSTDLIRKAPKPLVYTCIWDFMSEYGKQRGGIYQQAGHMGYPNDCIFVFDPGFETFCDKRARQLAATRDDPWLLGHFSDNELPFPKDALDRFLTLPPGDDGCKAAREWLTRRIGGFPDKNHLKEKIKEADRVAFLDFMADRYYRITSAAIRKYDPNHLFLGSRLHGHSLDSEPVFRAAGRYQDVISVNYYNAWTPEPEHMAKWVEWTGKPILVTEWYVKAVDSGMENKTGAGWTVKTQEDRGAFYQNFTLGLLESRICVGWHWFKYRDNDPNDPRADPSNRDSNKGVVTADFKEYIPLLESMGQLNPQVYPVIDYFDKARSVR